MVEVKRLWSDKNQTLGVLTIRGKSGQPIFACLTLERGDMGNKKMISNCPKGEYPLVLEYSPRFQTKLYELKDIPNRSEIKIHASNFWRQLNGCIALGLKLKDLDKDGYFDITNSRNTVKAFHAAMKDVKKTTIKIS